MFIYIFVFIYILYILFIYILFIYLPASQLDPATPTQDKKNWIDVMDPDKPGYEKETMDEKKNKTKASRLDPTS